MQTSTLTAALTAAGTSCVVASGTGYSTSTARPYHVYIDQESILVTLATATFTVLERGCDETRAAAHVSGATVYGPKFTPNPVSIGAYVASTGVLTPSVDFNIDTGTTGPIDIFTRGVTVQKIRQAVNKVIRELFYEDYVILTDVPDGDMRGAGITNWTAYGTLSASSGKVTNTNADEGPRALRALATAVNSGYRSDTMFIDPDYPTRRVRAKVRADVGTVTIRAYDATNSAEIATETHDSRAWALIDFTWAAPATCQGYYYEIEADTATSDVFCNWLQDFLLGAQEIKLPEWVIRAG